MFSPEFLADTAEALIADEAENYQEGAIDPVEYAIRLNRITTNFVFDLMEIDSTTDEQKDGLALIH